jgi:hypothetical protein
LVAQHRSVSNLGCLTEPHFIIGNAPAFSCARFSKVPRFDAVALWPGYLRKVRFLDSGAG